MDHTETAPDQAVVRRPLWEQPVRPEQPEPAQEPAAAQEPAVAQEPAADELDDDSDTETIDYPDPPQTGDREVDEAIGALAQAVGGPLEERLPVFDAAHRTLQDRLADVEG